MTASRLEPHVMRRRLFNFRRSRIDLIIAALALGMAVFSAYLNHRSGMALLWLVIALMSFLSGRFSRRNEIAIERRQKGQCARCGYNLTGNTSGVCPECGMPVPKEIADKSARPA